MSFYDGDERDYDASFSGGVWQSAKVSVVMSLLLSAFIALVEDKISLGNTLAYLVGVFFSLSFLTFFITLAFIFSIAFPARIILQKLDMVNELNLGLVCGFTTFTILMWMFEGMFKSFHFVIVFWSIVCGYVYMYGYKKENEQ